ncbi:hypothetical protein EHQ68_10290 [Leptospira congkakensis]|uniref:DUF1574 domain-containing protein n=1 Tax=Leptospira congkakensis TaxID=2484932 RepID=A0A4Z1AA46_9LEPT|nr:hypothetical protein EHQ68_10290 [Leptospira congkakensis]TGL95485.1 hypothetical protein EHQ69_02475 [Leptospira congkakensis]TGL96568.1 hypothetical protein EHQ70_09525 [Leptospira congkakensis]
MKWKVFVITCILFGGILFLDRLIFSELYFLFPNETEWDSSPWYNFIDKTKELQSSEDKHRTIITGSSVALYSVLPDELNKKENPKTKYSFFSHVAMAPTDLDYYKEDLLFSNPNLVVYLLNFADMQWEYLEPKNNEFYFNEDKWVTEFGERYPAKTIYPMAFLKDHWSELPRKTISKLAGKSLFYVSRFRVFFWDPIEVYVDNHFRSGRKYHLYQGEKPIEGIWSKGWTKETATLVCSDKKQKESIFFQKPNTKIRFRFYADQNSFINQKTILDIEKTFERSGWNDLEWDTLIQPSAEWSLVQIQILSELSSAKEVNLIRYGRDEAVGVRLSHFFCKTPKLDNRSYSRGSYWDDTRLVTMSVSDFKEDYFERMIRDAGTRNELWRLHSVREAKKNVNSKTFAPWWEFNRILSISDYFYKHKIPFVLVLSPENPIEFELYKNSQWRKDWISNLRSHLESRGQTLIDHTEVVTEVRYFFDPHHLTYEGANFYNSIFSKSLESQISKFNP